MYREWSFTERRLFHEHQSFNAWDPQKQTPVFNDPPDHDLDFFNRLRAAVPGRFTNSMTMLDVPDYVQRAADKPLRQQMQKADQELAIRTNPVKLFTDTGKPVCIITMEVTWRIGTRKDYASGKLNTKEVTSVWRGDKFTPVPLYMIDNLINYAMNKSGLLVEARLFYNRDSKYTSGKNLFWHMDFIKRIHVVPVGKIDELKLLLR
jgi:hypothetical protein